MISEGITTLMALNTGIRRLMLLKCVGIGGLVRLLKTDDTGSAANTLGTTLLPSLSLLQVRDLLAPDADGLHALFARRPTLRIEHSDMPVGLGCIDGNKLKETIEEFGQNEEPGVFNLYDFERKIVVREDGDI